MSNDKVYDKIMAKIGYQYNIYDRMENTSAENLDWIKAHERRIQKQTVNELITLFKFDDEIQGLIK